MSRLRDESGITLIEVLVASVISLIILGATMSLVAVMARGANDNDRQNEAEQTARLTLDTLARQLRNLASPTLVTEDAAGTSQPRSIERDLPTDLIFKDVDQVQPAGSLNKPNVRRVRYCLNGGTLYMQTQTWIEETEPPMPADAACPGSGWTTGPKTVATHVTNGARALFTYSGDAGAITATDSTSRAEISRLTATLYVDADTTQRPAETQLVTSVFLRNQNREPVASIKPTILNSATRTVQLDGSDSRDPEGQTLTYHWSVDGDEIDPKGVVVQVNVSAGQHTFELQVKDPANLEGDAQTTITTP